MFQFVPTANNGSPELVRVHKAVRSGDIWCVFQKLKYVWKPDEQVFAGLEFPVDKPYDYYLKSQGFEDENDLANKRRIFGNNAYGSLR